MPGTTSSVSLEEERRRRRESERAKPHVPRIVPLLNNLTRALLRIGIPLGPTTLLTVRGRRTGKLRRQPVGFFRYEGCLYLFSTFGETNWVRNVRAEGGRVTVGTGWRGRAVLARELTPSEAAPVIKMAIAPALSNPFAKMILGPHIAVALDAPWTTLPGRQRDIQSSN